MNGGPAFPCIVPFPKEGDEIDFGMTLRDYFAGQALIGFCALPGFNHDAYAMAAKKAYAFADALIKERDR